jgi:hypothetical protein
MANVRIDAQGVPKAPVYESTTPVIHRASLTGADAVDPTSAGAGLDCSGYRNVRFDLDTTGSLDITALTVQLLAWNPTAAKYFRGAERRFDQEDLEANPIPSLEAEVRGAIVFLKVVDVTAGSLSLSIYASLS